MVIYDNESNGGNMTQLFDITVQDSQGTEVTPIEPEVFDLNQYTDYETTLLEKSEEFIKAESGILVYRRVRANGVFYDKCRNKKESLALQLGALQESMKCKGDIANFLEPWYGIGYIASSFGGEYIWSKGQSPSVRPPFHCVKEIMDSNCTPIAETPIGKYILEMEEFFLDKTKGKLPISFCDVQSPLNMLTYLLPINELFMEIYDEPDTVIKAADLTASLLIDFLKKQQELIGDCLVRPGHGFASTRVFNGVGMSDDNSIMLQPDDYIDLFQPSDERIGEAFGGTVYHSCGNWENKIAMVKGFRNIKTVDGAFSIQTDPSPNNPAVFGKEFDGTGIVINARAVGNLEESFQAFKELWTPRQKLIAVTYCKDPVEQSNLYDRLHNLVKQ